MMSIMRPLLLVSMLSASAFAQSGNLGIFTDSGDVGGPAIKGFHASFPTGSTGLPAPEPTSGRSRISSNMSGER